jgi:hypothetical protein
MTLVEDVKQSWKWFSMQAMALAGTLQTVWLTIPDDLKTQVPHNLVNYLTLVLVVAGMVGRTVKQGATVPVV